MTPEQAAICLRDDPTFATSSREDLFFVEALPLDAVNQVDVGLAVYPADGTRPRAPAIMGPGDEGDRKSVV